MDMFCTNQGVLMQGGHTISPLATLPLLYVRALYDITSLYFYVEESLLLRSRTFMLRKYIQKGLDLGKTTIDC